MQTTVPLLPVSTTEPRMNRLCPMPWAIAGTAASIEMPASATMRVFLTIFTSLDGKPPPGLCRGEERLFRLGTTVPGPASIYVEAAADLLQLGRAPGRERGCKYV